MTLSLTNKPLAVCCSMMLLAQMAHAQIVKTDTFWSETAGHVFLNIKIPSGEFFFQSSRLCGKTISKLNCSNPNAVQEVTTLAQPNGNIQRNVSLAYQMPNGFTAKSLAAANPVSSNKGAYRSMYATDPSAQTDLRVTLESGSSRLDLSGLSLTNATIQSTFSDVFVSYASPNRVNMHKMNIEAARAMVVLKNPEYAHADLISIKNDMGDTKVQMESSEMNNVNINIRSGAGTCTLVIHPMHAVKVVVRKGYLAKVNLAGDFQEVSENTYANEAFRKCQRGSIITCETDLGTIHIMSNAQ